MTAIRARRVSFGWDGTPLHWVPGDPQTTHTMNVLHLLLPAGERWFVKVYQEALPLVSDDALRADMKGFVGQESMHSRAHSAVLDHLGAQGIDTKPFTDRVEWLFERILGDHPPGARSSPGWRRAWLHRRLAIVAAIEHFTSVLGAWVLDSPALDAAAADPVMLDLLRWHGAEEVEHRHVAFEVFEHLSGRRIRRFPAMAASAFTLTYFWITGTRFLMAHDPARPGPASWREFRRAGRQGRLPTLGRIFATSPDFFKRSYHPCNYGSTQVALDYLAISPAARDGGPAAT